MSNKYQSSSRGLWYFNTLTPHTLLRLPLGFYICEAWTVQGSHQTPGLMMDTLARGATG